MKASLTLDRLTERVTSVYLESETAMEEIFLSELHKILAEEVRGKIVLDGERVLTWMQKNRGGSQGECD